MKLVRERTGLNLAQAKSAVERVLDGEQIAFSFETEDAPSAFRP
jgi:ribosomal protein L7/L12